MQIPDDNERKEFQLGTPFTNLTPDQLSERMSETRILLEMFILETELGALSLGYSVDEVAKNSMHIRKLEQE